MGDYLYKFIDVIIDYLNGVLFFWDFVSGKVCDICVNINVMFIKDIMENGIFNDNYFDDL